MSQANEMNRHKRRGKISFHRNFRPPQTFAEMLRMFRLSIADGYLPDDWYTRYDEIVIVSGDTRYFALCSDTVFSANRNSDTGAYDVWHTEHQCDKYVELAYTNGFVIGGRHYYYANTEDDDLVVRGFYGITRGWLLYGDDNVYCISCEYYHESSFDDNDIAFAAENGEPDFTSNLYYWNCDDRYHVTEEPCDDDDDDDDDDGYDDDEDNKLFSYRSGYATRDFRKFEPGEISIGFEIEKNDMPDFAFNRRKLLDDGFVIEADGSVSSGFELKTPIYRLYDSDTDKHIEQIKGFCDVKNVRNAGGHVNIGIHGMTDEEILDAYRGWIPFIYGMYHGRLNNHYCSGKKVTQLKSDKDKYQAIALHHSYIEFRIVSSVKSFKNIMWRIELFRIISKHLNKPFSKILRLMLKDAELRSHLSKVYTNRTLNLLIARSIDQHIKYGEGITHHATGRYIKMRDNIFPIHDNTRDDENNYDIIDTEID